MCTCVFEFYVNACCVSIFKCLILCGGALADCFYYSISLELVVKIKKEKSQKIRKKRKKKKKEKKEKKEKKRNKNCALFPVIERYITLPRCQNLSSMITYHSSV